MTTPTTAQLRAWARAQGMDVGDRGRLSPQVRQAWDAAHPTGRPKGAEPPPEPPPVQAGREAARDAEAEQRFADLERQVGELARRVTQLERAAEAAPRRRRFGRRE